jgi:hypothetical protein
VVTQQQQQQKPQQHPGSDSSSSSSAHSAAAQLEQNMADSWGGLVAWLWLHHYYSVCPCFDFAG